MTWQERIKQLETFPHGVSLKIDGKYNLSLVSSISRRKIVIMWYLDRKWKGEYYNKESEIGQLFGCPIKITMFKSLYNLEKMRLGKKKADEAKKEYDATVRGYSPFWKSASSLIKHLTKFKTIEIN
jgi:hypothetical protein